MSRSTIRRGIAVSLAAAIAAAGFAACNPKTVAFIEPPKVTAEDEKQVAGAPMYLGGPEDHPETVTMKIRATPTLTSYFDSLSNVDLVAYLNTLQYDLDSATSEIDSVTCIHRPSGVPCGPTEAARVFIEPVVGMHMWKKSVIPKYGVVAARIINYDVSDRAEANFGFPPHSQVWWVVDSIPGGGGLRSRFFARNYNANAPAVTLIGTEREFNECRHIRETRHKHAKAKFMDCLQSAVYSAAETAGDPVMRPAKALGGLPIFYQVGFGAVPVPSTPYIKALSDTWVTCDAGCCSTSR
jgi:hypothetical protein